MKTGCRLEPRLGSPADHGVIQTGAPRGRKHPDASALRTMDVHSKQSVFAIADATGKWVAEGEVPTTPAGLTALRERHALAPQTPVALETGTSAFFVARQLSALGLAPVVVDAHKDRVKAHRPTQKSDRRDAVELCEGLRRGIYRAIVHVPSAAVARVRDTLSRRRHFVRVRTAEINAAKRLLRAAGLGRTAVHSAHGARLGLPARDAGPVERPVHLPRPASRTVALRGRATRCVGPGSWWRIRARSLTTSSASRRSQAWGPLSRRRWWRSSPMCSASPMQSTRLVPPA